MAQETMRSPRRRPVDVLFGEEVELKPKPTAAETDAKQAMPGYMVEPPRPVTSVRPPPPEFPNDWRATPTPEPVVVVEPPLQIQAQPDPVAPPPKPPIVEIPAVNLIQEAVTFTVSEERRRPNDDGQSRVEPSAPLFVAPPAPVPPGPVAPDAPVSPYGQMELLELSQFVDQLYQNVADETSDSAALNAECLANLNAARAGIEKGEYAQAEASAELVKARLLRARASRAAAASQTTRLLFAGLLFAALVGSILFIVPFVLRIVPVVIPLLRGAGLGMLGGAAMALWQLSQHITRRDLDAAFHAKYALSPLFGALLGAVAYLLSLLGILAAPNALGISGEPALMYLFAFLAGIFNDAVIGALRGRVARQKM